MEHQLQQNEELSQIQGYASDRTLVEPSVRLCGGFCTLLYLIEALNNDYCPSDKLVGINSKMAFSVVEFINRLFCNL